ncbi:MAG TPA: alpha/beta hydrolase [Thermoanaerobaculia bacterium]|nr:alpha/beta hydrolase [Thermoanaerobaculia bacterium]
MTTEQERMAAAVSRPLLLKVPGSENVRVLRDVAYAQTPAGALLADVYLPPLTRKAPMVIFIHGGVPAGVPRPKEWGFFQSWGRTVAASGLVAIAFNHRLGYPDTRIREGAADLDAMLAYTAAHAPDWNADPQRVALLAFSAGGPLLSHPLRDRPASVRCLVSFYNILDISKSPVYAASETPETIREFSPVKSVTAESPPILVVRAGKDSPGLNESIAAFVARAVETNAPLTFLNHPNGVHGFENTTDDERTREILETTIAFMKRHTE